MILYLHPDDRSLGADGLGVNDLGSAVTSLRRAYCDHRAIASIGCIEVVALPGAEHAKDAIEAALASFLHDMGNSVMDCWVGAKHALQNMANMEHEPKHDAITGVYDGTILCIASGPSVTKWIPAIREVQDRVCIVAADSILSGLVAAGIHPHFVCMLERDPLLAPMIATPSGHTQLIVPAVAYPPAVAPWSGRRIWWWQGFPDLYRWLGDKIPQTGTGRSAGTMAAAAAVAIGGSKVYLIGHDLCRSDSGSSHADGAHEICTTAHKGSSATVGLHADIDAGNGKKTCEFWQLCRSDLAVLASENPGVMRTLGADGLDIPGIPREHAIDTGPGTGFRGDMRQAEPECEPHEDEPVGDPVDSSALVTPSDPPIYGISQKIAADIGRFSVAAKRIHELSRTPTAEAIAEAITLAHPSSWADPRLAGMYTYVFGPIFRAASLRAYLREQSPGAHADGFDIILRTIPQMLRIMMAETMPALRAAALSYDIDMSRNRAIASPEIAAQEMAAYTPEQHHLIFNGETHG